MSLIEPFELVKALAHRLQLRLAALDVLDELIEHELVLEEGDLPGIALHRRMVIDELLLGGLVDGGGGLDLVVLVGGGAGLLELLLI